MRILALTQIFPHASDPQSGIFAARRFAAFQRQGAEVVVIWSCVWIPRILRSLRTQWRDRERKLTPSSEYGLQVVRVPILRLGRGLAFCRWDGLLLYHGVKQRVLGMHRERPFDLVFGSGLFPGADTAGRLSRLLGIPSVGLAIGGDANVAPSHSKALARHFVRVARSMDGLLANGHGVAKHLEEASERECRIADGVVDLNLFRPLENKCPLRAELGVAETHDIVLFAGYLKREKGIYELLDAFAQVRRQSPQAALAICGRGVEENGLMQRIGELGLQDWVRLVGQIPPSQMWKWMQASDIFALPSYHEGMPNAVMEAMACGLPVISTNVGGLPAAVGDSGGAVLVEPGQSETLATALQSVLSDRSLRQRMGQAARATAVQKFGVDNNARQLLAYLQQLVDECGASFVARKRVFGDSSNVPPTKEGRARL